MHVTNKDKKKSKIIVQSMLMAWLKKSRSEETVTFMENDATGQVRTSHNINNFHLTRVMIKIK